MTTTILNAAERLMTLIQLAPRWSDADRDRLLAKAAELERAAKAAKAAKEAANAAKTPHSRAKEVHLTDVGNALRFAEQHRDEARYCAAWGKWLLWTGTHWQEDQRCGADLLAKDTVRSILAEARGQTHRADSLIRTQQQQGQADDRHTAAVGALDSAKALSQHAFKSEASPRIAAMLRLAQSELPVTPDELDADPYLFNCLNGTLELRSGTFRPHRREDNLTKAAPVAYDPAAACPRFEAALRSIFPESPLAEDAPGDLEMIAFVRRYLGMCLSGDVSEQVLAIFHGDGSNGKSVLLETVCAILGPYAGPTPEGLLLARRAERHPTELADLFGRRLAHTTETGAGARLDETRVKRLTGGDTVKARRCNEDFWSFRPTHKLLVLTNHRPRIGGTDHAVWRRVLLVPFAATFWNPDEPARAGEVRPERFRRDAELTRSHFRDEWPGILNWLLCGCRDWLQNGLRPPATVRAAVEEYRREQDVVLQYTEEYCDLHESEELRTKSGELHTHFTDKMRVKISRREFTQRIVALTGFEVAISGVRWLPGITIRKGDGSGDKPAGDRKTSASGSKDEDYDLDI